MTYSQIHEFTEEGLALFKKVFNGTHDEKVLDETKSELATPVEGTGAFTPREYKTTKEMAQAVIDSIGEDLILELLPRNGVWAWLTFVLRDQVMPRDKNGRRKTGEIWRWYPSDPNDFQKAQRHLVRMPVLLKTTLRENSDHLLCGKPSVPGEVREQMTSQQDMFTQSFQRVGRTLYYDELANKLKRGSGGKGGGSPRRLAAVRKQLDVTWEIIDLPFEEIMTKLPPEFDRFRESV